MGVSPDPLEALRQFRTDLELPYPLLSDEGGRVAQAYGVWQPRTRDGVTTMGVARTTFVIDEEGRIARVFVNVNVDGHADEVIAAL